MNEARNRPLPYREPPASKSPMGIPRNRSVRAQAARTSDLYIVHCYRHLLRAGGSDSAAAMCGLAQKVRVTRDRRQLRVIGPRAPTTEGTDPTDMISILDCVPWQMIPGERAALEGLLCQIRPDLAVEIGTAVGGSLQSIAKHSSHVHSFDLVAPPTNINELTNVTVHTGDSHVLLPQVLGELAQDGRNVDFALVDGDHTADGVERDIRDLLDSEAVSSSIIVVHDTMNDEVRAGLARIDASTEPKIAYHDPHFLPGRLHYGYGLHHQLWGGLGVMVVDAETTSTKPLPRADQNAYSMYELVAPTRDALIAQDHRGEPTGPGSVREALAAGRAPGDELLHLRAELAELQRRFSQVANSRSWRVTAPLRATAKLIRQSRA